MSHDRMTPAGGQVAVFGSLNADLTVRVDRFPEPGETLSGSELVVAPGGKGSNQAVAAAVLGSEVRLIGAVGDDSNGRYLLEEASGAGVDVSSVDIDRHHATGSAMIVVDNSGENTIIVSPGANWVHTPTSVGSSDFASDVVCLCLEVPLPAVLAAAEQGRRAGAQVLLNLSPFAEVPDALLQLSDVLLVNQTEGELLLRARGIDEDWSATLDALARHGADRAVVTLGSQGSVVLDGTATGDGRVVVIPAEDVQVVDTTGCGDAFTGALAHGLAGGLSLVEAAHLAARVSALAATRDGAQASYRTFAHVSPHPDAQGGCGR